MSLSVCLIARNEEQNLPRALASVRDVADELVVVDTGSTDRTIEIARQFKARVHRFAWCEDFSAARNYALEQATCDWIFWLDCDEELLTTSSDPLHSILKDAQTLACYVLRQDLIDVLRPEVYTKMWQLRLFRRDPRLRFVGRCHPDFRPDIESIAARSGQQVRLSDITLRHYGYVTELKQSKLLRALRLLELELQDRPDQLYYLIELGRTQLALGEPKGHETLARATLHMIASMDNPQPPVSLVAPLLEYLMQLPDDQLPHDLTPERVRSLAHRWFPRSAPLIWLRARQAFDASRFGEAEQLLRLLVSMGRDHSYDLHLSFDPRFVGGDALLNLGVCLVRQTRLPEARQCFMRLLGDPTHSAAARQNLDAIDNILKEASHSTRRTHRPGD